jgi:signal-transduction protein with cAMP-binding, CBS, and nucleotidyltransferase domain
MTLDSAVHRMAEELKGIQIFEKLPMQALQQLAVAVHLDFFEALDALEVPQDALKCYYLVTRGEFLVRKGSSVESHYKAPAIIGWHESMAGTQAPCEVLFTAESVLMEMPVAETRYLLAKDPYIEDMMKDKKGFVIEV